MKELIYMRNIWKILGVGAVLLTMIGVASAWSPGWGWTTTENEVSTDDVIQKAEEILKNADLEEFLSYRYDTMHYRIVNEGEYVGVLWENVELSDLTAGEPYPAMWGWRVPLIYNGDFIGHLFVNGTSKTIPTNGYEHGHGYCWGIAGFPDNDAGKYRYSTGNAYKHANGYGMHGGMMHGGWW